MRKFLGSRSARIGAIASAALLLGLAGGAGVIGDIRSAAVPISPPAPAPAAVSAAVSRADRDIGYEMAAARGTTDAEACRSISLRYRAGCLAYVRESGGRPPPALPPL